MATKKKAATPRKKTARAKRPSNGKVGNKVYSPEVHAEMLRLICDDGISETAVCEKIGVSRATLFRWKKKYPTLATEMKVAKTEHRVGKVVEALYVRAVGFTKKIKHYYIRDGHRRMQTREQYFPPSEAMIKFLLTNEDSGNYRERQGLDGTIVTPGIMLVGQVARTSEDWATRYNPDTKPFENEETG